MRERGTRSHGPCREDHFGGGEHCSCGPQTYCRVAVGMERRVVQPARVRRRILHAALCCKSGNRRA